jgi:hypothetical protein
MESHKPRFFSFFSRFSAEFEIFGGNNSESGVNVFTPGKQNSFFERAEKWNGCVVTELGWY